MLHIEHFDIKSLLGTIELNARRSIPLMARA